MTRIKKLCAGCGLMRNHINEKSLCAVCWRKTTNIMPSSKPHYPIEEQNKIRTVRGPYKARPSCHLSLPADVYAGKKVRVVIVE